MKVYIVQHWANNTTQVENIAAFNDRDAAVTYADELEENGEYPKNTLFVEEVELLG